MEFPVDQVIGELNHALVHQKRAVFQAPPGAGKTTRVPMALLREPWLEKKKILMLEPRRLAVRSCAAYMADRLNEPVGQTIGYRVRMDKKVSSATRIEVVTQGVFIRMIQNDPALEGVGLVIFDEFHERNLANDLGFALCQDASEAFCEHLSVLVMSATMDHKAVSALMDQAPVIRSQGRSFEVETLYLKSTDRMNRRMPVEQACAMAVQQALKHTQGDILVFLPGVAEIQRVKTRLDLIDDAEILLLYGNLPFKDQRRVFQPARPGFRKIVLSTSIAETSLTIDGIKVVIDSGLMRVSVFSARTGMSRLETRPVSKAAADQRRGRAGRTAKGICYRLWSEYEHRMLSSYTLPEVLTVDLSNLALELAAWGVTDPAPLKWMDAPDPVRFDQARQLLIMLGGLDDKNRITAHGRQMARMGIHPRLAHMILMAEDGDQVWLACLIAALISERDILIFDSGESDPDIGLRLEVLQDILDKKNKGYQGFRVKVKLARRIVQTALFFEAAVQTGTGKRARDPIDIGWAGDLLAMAYPDRVAKKRAPGGLTFLMASGNGACFKTPGLLTANEYIVAAHLDDGRGHGHAKNAAVFLAAGYSKEELKKRFSRELTPRVSIEWNDHTGSVQAVEQVFFKKIRVDEKKLSGIDPEKSSVIMLEQIRKRGLPLLPWTKKLKRLRERILFLKQVNGFDHLPDLSDTKLLQTLEKWLMPFLSGVHSLKTLDRIDLEGALLSMVPWADQQLVRTHAPTHIIVPSGSKKPLIYSCRDAVLNAPVLEVRLQEMFSLESTPKIAGQSVPVTLHLLSPAGRPVQITNDLKSFWENTYPDVKKELKGRYPKHYWPDDPISAVPTSRVRPKR